jgi:hypothetical protein
LIADNSFSVSDKTKPELGIGRNYHVRFGKIAAKEGGLVAKQKSLNA